MPRERLPLLWDCDFLHGEPEAGARDRPAEERFVLCEVNVSSVSPFPPSSVPPFVAAVQKRLAAVPARR